MARIVKATFLRELGSFRGTAKFYRLSEPVRYCWCDGDEKCPGEDHFTQYVVVSAAVSFLEGPETYIFPASPDGDVISWGEMEGSFKGALNHKRAIEKAGWIYDNGNMK